MLIFVTACDPPLVHKNVDDTVVEFNRPDGVKVKCDKPAENIVKGYKGKIDASSDLLKDGKNSIINLGGSAEAQIKELRKVTQSVTDFKALRYLICADYGNGIIDKETYKNWISKIIPSIKGEGFSSESKPLKITQLNLLNEKHTEIIDHGFKLTDMEVRASNTYEVNNISQLKLAFIVVAEGIKADEDGSIDVRARAYFKHETGKITESVDLPTYLKLNQWKTRPLVEKLGYNVVSSFIGVDPKSDKNFVVYLIILDQIKDHELLNGKNTLNIEITDEKSNAKIIESKEFQLEIEPVKST